MDWNNNPTVKRWILIISAFVIIMLLLVMCLGEGTTTQVNR